MRNYVLNNGVQIPAIGLGTWHNTDENTVIDTILNAIEIGYNHIDTATVYGNEAFIGKAIRQSGVNRESLFITSKVWRTSRGYQNTLHAFEQTINDLQVDYLDLYLIHWPASHNNYDNWAEINAETWHAMEDLYKAGKIRAIGLSNFWRHHIDALMPIANIKPMVNQIEHHPGYTQADVVEYCKQNDILVEAWSPLGRGMVLHEPTLQQIAQKYGVSVAQVCIQWCLKEGILPLPKSTRKERLIDNLNISGFELSEDDLSTINALNLGSSSGSYPDSLSE